MLRLLVGALVWIAVGGEGDRLAIEAVASTSLQQTDAGKVCVITAGAGNNMSRWLPLIAGIEAYAREEGCMCVRIFGRKGWLPQYQKMTRAGLFRSLRDAGALLFQSVPGQLNMRAQLVLSTAYLGAETTALFIYAKQVVTASTQIIAFVLRVDFPGLVEKMSGPREHSFRSILNAQRTTLYCAVALTVGAMIASGIAAIVPDFRLHRAATILVAFAPTILTLSLSLMMIQALAALAAYAAIAKSLAISTAAGMMVSYILVSTLDVYAFVLGEVTLNVVSFYIAYRDLRRLS